MSFRYPPHFGILLRPDDLKASVGPVDVNDPVIGREFFSRLEKILVPAIPATAPAWYSTANPGNLISPHYAYDSRSWITASNSAPPKNYTDTGVKRSDSDQLLEKVVMNRLPPLVEVIMVAIDDKSAQKLNSLYGAGSTPPLNNPALLAKLNLNNAFTDANKLHDFGGIKGDLSKLEDGLNSLALNYRIFHTEVRLPGASYGE